MKQIFFLLLLLCQLFILKSATSQIYLITSEEYKYGNGRATIHFNNYLYDYYVFRGLLDTSDRIYFRVYTGFSTIYIYTYSTKSKLSATDIGNTYIESFQEPYVEWELYDDYPIQYRYSFDHKKIMEEEYYYIAIHLPSSASRTTYDIGFDSYTLSATEIAIIIIIIIAVFVGLALISMGVAKMMGRSPLDGLLCFFILCAICCCRRR